MNEQQTKLSQSEAEKRNKLKREKPLVYEKVLKFDEKVKKGESIAILQLQYDYRCNFQCQHCCISKMEKKKRKFTVADVKELSRQADEMGLANIVLTGGEPLIFPEFDEIIEAIDPSKFYITSDTNGWYLDEAKAKHLKNIGVDKIQLSVDSLSAAGHDDFRRKPGSHERTIKAIDAAQAAGLNIIVATVVTKQRIRSNEFEDFLKFMNGKGVGVFVSYAKPVGEWEGNTDILITKDDMAQLRELEKKYNVFSHLTPSYGLNLGCIAIKRMVSLTMYGDVMPCPFIHVSLGNFFEEPLKDIINRGMKLEYFSKHIDTCLVAEDREFLEKYEAGRIHGKQLPVPCKKVFIDDDMMK